MEKSQENLKIKIEEDLNKVKQCVEENFNKAKYIFEILKAASLGHNLEGKIDELEKIYKDNQEYINKTLEFNNWIINFLFKL